METVEWGLHHQAVVDCPKCNEMIVEDLGECAESLGMEIECPNCGYQFQLGEQRD